MRSVLEGKVAIITGATGGIGARTAALFVAEGARVVLAGRRVERGDHVAKTLGPSALFVRTDVTIETDVKAMIEQTSARFGRLDCLMNNAGTGSQHVGIADVDLERFDAAIALHVRGVLAAMKYAVPVMTAQGSGSIINVASINGTRAGLGGHYYSVAKAASIHLTHCAEASPPMTPTTTSNMPKPPSPLCFHAGNRFRMSGMPTTSPRRPCSWPATRPAS